MQTHNIIFGLVFAFLFSCSDVQTDGRQENTISVDSLESGLEPLQVTTASSEKKIISFQDTLYYGDTLKISFKTPHPTDFAITSPNDGFFYVVYAGNDTTMPSLVDSEKFETMNYIEIITNKTKANPWNKQFTENQIIFSTSGKYELLLSSNLETDDGTPVEKETIFYFDKPKTK